MGNRFFPHPRVDRTKIRTFSGIKSRLTLREMSHLPKEWRFLRSAWIYATVLTGEAESATALVTETLKTIAGRADVVSPRRRKRLFFSTLFRAATAPPTEPRHSSDTPAAVKTFHSLPEPGRSALTLLYLRVFPPEELAGILGKTPIELADVLQSTRPEFSNRIPPIA